MVKAGLPDNPQLKSQYELERHLAQRLREAGKSERKGLYCEIYDEYAQRVLDHPLLQRAHREARRGEIELQAQLLAPFVHRTSRVLEVGGGDGRLAARMACSVGDYYLIEASRRFSANLERPANVHLLHTDQPPFDLPSKSVDVVFSCHFVEHLHPDDLGDFNREFLRLLVPGGRCICVTPNRLYGPHDVSKHFDAQATGLHLREYTYRELERSFVEAGFSPIFALSGVDRSPKLRSPGPRLAVEGMLELMPQPLLRRLLSLMGRIWPAPFRPLEQVVLMGSRPLRDGTASSATRPKHGTTVAEPFLHVRPKSIYNPLTDRTLYAGEEGEGELRKMLAGTALNGKEIRNHLEQLGWAVPAAQDLENRFFLKYVSLETHSSCNQACYFCPVSVNPRPHVRMPSSLFLEILGQLSEFRGSIEAVFLNQYNEPTTDKDFPAQVAMIKQAGLLVALLSNATGLTPSCSEALSNSGGVAFLRVNLSTLDRKRYATDRGRDHLPLVLRNLDYLAQHPVADRMEIAVLGEGDARHHEEFRRIGDRFKGTPFDVLEFVANDRASYLDNGQSVARPKLKLKGCQQMGSRPLQHLHILADGSCVLCCQDYKAEYVIGNLKRQTVREVLQGPEISKLRRWAYGLEEAPADFICRHCLFARSS